MRADNLKKLNAAQLSAVTHQDGPLLIVAGAGTGKTTVLINRLAHLFLEKKVASDQVLLLTFTEKAAGEMEERADKILPYGYVDLWINTFHSFGERILRESGLEIGLNASFKLLNETEQWMLIRKNLSSFRLEYYRPLGNPTKFISELIRHFSRLKDENISPAEYLAYAEQLEKGGNGAGEALKSRKKKSAVRSRASARGMKADAAEEELETGRIRELARAYGIYNQLLLDNNFLDFGDLVIYTLKLFRERPNILRQYRDRFRYVMVDEFQDTNWAQYELVKLLTAPRNNLVVVGDDDQAIYKFRGASLSNILQFKDDYPSAKEVVLNDNYRSRQEILDRAYEFIQHNNPNRLEAKLGLDKKLRAGGSFSDSAAGPAVQFLNFDRQEDEVFFVGQKIREIYAQHQGLVQWSDFAVLVRANDTADAFVKELGRQDIPAQFMSWRGLYYKPLILDILAYFRLLDNYHESAALFRVLSMEAFKVSHSEMININKLANRRVWSLYEALENIQAVPGISGESVSRIRKLLSLIKEHSALARNTRPTRIFLRFAYDSGLLQDLDRDRDLEQYSYLNQFYQKMKRLEENEPDLRLKDFLAAINLELEAGESGALKLDFADPDVVKIMTVHGAKGLEFRYVFIVNLVDKKFPTIARGEKISIPAPLVRERLAASPDAHLEEERRLFYVAATRAKEALYLTGAKDYGGVREKKPSRFISELGLEAGEAPAVALSERNQFLRDLHRLNAGELEMVRDKAENYPLPEKFSFSQLAAYSTCPLQYKFAFILKIPAEGDKASLVFGRVLHNTLYNFLLPFLSPSASAQGQLFADAGRAEAPAAALLSESRLLGLYEEFWQTEGYRDAAQRDEYRAKGLAALKKFWTAFSSAPVPSILFLEKRFSFRLGQETIKGTIDRVDQLPDGQLEVIDYKTGKSKSRLEFKDKRQLILYQLFLEEFLGRSVGALSFYYLETGEKLTFQATEKDISRLREEVGKEIAAIRSRDFRPTPSQMCDFCDFNQICEFRQL